MNLLIDFGNTCCKWARYGHGTLQQAEALKYLQQDPNQRVHQCIHAFDLSKVKHIHAVSVLGSEFEQVFLQQLARVCDIEVTFHVSHKEKFGILLGYKDALSFGADRYAALVAAYHHCQGNKIVIDCGTATTIDAIDASGQHEGGLIMPGVQLMQESLVKRAAGIRLDDKNRTPQLLSDNTCDAVYSGCVLQLEYAIRGITKQLCKRKHYQLFLTGGESRLLHTAMPESDENWCKYRPHLVLEGLQIMQG